MPLDRPLRLSEMVARVGGLKQGASDNIVLRRANGTIERHNLTAIARNEARDVVMQPGDSVFATAAPIHLRTRNGVKADSSQETTSSTYHTLNQAEPRRNILLLPRMSAKRPHTKRRHP